ncbi:hypothetical protein BDF19DRAFT_420010 [Syncephalis fuscata]|nr:hypothetical protein BDF19DRAFT_420010 [Syncephalis fuscata]
MRKRDFWAGLTRFLDAFFRKDAYGFFHQPVDTTIVTDYLTVIRKPMDLTTMRTKVLEHSYVTLEEFRDDIALICNNARIYNKPDTIYYREAARLWEYADRVLKRSGSHLLSPEKDDQPEQTIAAHHESSEWNKKNWNEEEVDVVGMLADGQTSTRINTTVSATTTPVSVRSSSGNQHKTNDSSYSSVSTKKPAYHNIRRRKYVDASFRTLADGSFKEFEEEQWLASLPDYGLPPTLQVTSVTNNNKGSEIIEKPAGFLDYGPYARLAPKNPPPTADRAMYLFSTYGDEIGEAYARSLEAFTCDMDDDVKLLVHERLNRLSEGAHAIVHQVVQIAAQQNETK